MYGQGQSVSSLYPKLEEAVLRGDKVFNMSGGEQLRAACDKVSSGKLIGWVYQSSTSLLSGGKKAGADWSLPDAREVRPLKDGAFGTAVCTLPAGTVIHVQDDAQKVDKAYYVPVNGKKYSLP